MQHSLVNSSLSIFLTIFDFEIAGSSKCTTISGTAHSEPTFLRRAIQGSSEGDGVITAYQTDLTKEFLQDHLPKLSEVKVKPLPLSDIGSRRRSWSARSSLRSLLERLTTPIQEYKQNLSKLLKSIV